MQAPGDYYNRKAATAIDGTPIFKTAEDDASESRIAKALESEWRCTLRSFGRLSPVDWYAERDGRLIGVIELKSRSHPSTRFPTVFLNVRKWLALQLAAVGLGVPAIFVVEFTDCVRWISVADVDPSRARVGGCLRMVKSRSDVEPVIEVEIEKMAQLRKL